jgi:hypothetical protein
MPRSTTSTPLVIPNWSLTLVTWLATVVGSPVFPANTVLPNPLPAALLSLYEPFYYPF